MNFDAPATTTLVDKTPARAAAALLDKYWDGRLPVDPLKIANALGIAVVPRGGPNDLDYVYSGYFNNSGSAPAIEYNMSESLVRQRFTLAHELGHFALGHASAPRDMPANFTTGVADVTERQANQFAAELLMPAAALRSLVQSGTVADLDALANAFRTSRVAMSYRLQNLGLI